MRLALGLLGIFAHVPVNAKSTAMGSASSAFVAPSLSWNRCSTREENPSLFGFFSSDEETGEAQVGAVETIRMHRIRDKVSRMAKNVVLRPKAAAVPMPRAIVEILKDATLGAVELAVDEVIARRGPTADRTTWTSMTLASSNIADLIDEAFSPVEASLVEMEESLVRARRAMQSAKAQLTQSLETVQALDVVEAVAIAQAEGATTDVVTIEEIVTQNVLGDIYSSLPVDVSGLTYDDVGYHQSEMAPPFLDEAQCLIPGEAVVRVEKAPENSRRIFAGIDIPVSVETVWNVLTDYANLQKVVPNLVVNEVLELFEGSPANTRFSIDSSQPYEKQCETLTTYLKGALLRQVGGAKVVGINFSARTTLEVREWPQGMPDFAHFQDSVFEGKSRDARVSDNIRVKLERYKFPRPFALSSLPTRDISMQSIENDNGEFRMYQGVWRMQPLPGCAPEGKDAMRLTYAVEVSPRAYLPVSIIEGRIVSDLCTNLAAIRDFVTEKKGSTIATANKIRA